jgi:hypothetical protein
MHGERPTDSVNTFLMHMLALQYNISTSNSRTWMCFYLAWLIDIQF